MISSLDVWNKNRESCMAVAAVYSHPSLFLLAPQGCPQYCANGLCVVVFPTVVCHCISSLVDLLQVFKASLPSFAVQNPSQGLLGCISGWCSQRVTYPNIHCYSFLFFVQLTAFVEIAYGYTCEDKTNQ